MKHLILFLFFFLVMAGIPSSAHPDQQQTACFHVVPLSSTQLQVSVNRIYYEEITDFYIDDIKIEPKPIKEAIGGTNIYKIPTPDINNKSVKLTLKVGTKTVYEDLIQNVPFTSGLKQQFPFIISAEPRMVVAGNVLTIKGKNFGNNPDNITMFFLNCTPIRAAWIGLDDQGKDQLIQFILPENTPETSLYDSFHFFKTSALLYIELKTQDGILNSNWIKTGVAKSNIHYLLMGTSLLLILIILSAIYYVVLHIARQKNPTKKATFLDVCSMIVSDKKTNTLSLSKLQALMWTIAIFWSYIYLAIGKIYILCDYSIPSLSDSLIGLLGISYGGLIAARGLGNSRPKNDLVSTEQKISDFFCENNEISLPRLQLFIFTFVGIAVYVFTLFNPDIFTAGLPDIPGTLNSLFLVSQGGYLGGKLTTSSVVNYLLPRRTTSGSKAGIMLIGRGFTDHTKVLLQGSQSPIETEFVNQNTLKFDISTLSLETGTKQIVVIPPTGSSFVVDDALEVIAIKIHKTLIATASGETAMEVDFKDIALGGEPLAAHLLPLPTAPILPGGTPPSTAPQGDTPLSITHVAGNRYRVTRPGGLTTGDTIRIAALDGSFAFETTVGGTATEGYEPVTLI